MAVFCCRYLTSGPFKLGAQERSIRDSALSGYYGFQDYAAAFWHHHVDSVLNLAADLPVQLSEDMARSVFCLLGDYEVEQRTGSTTSGSQTVPTAQKIRKILQEWRDNGQKGSFEERTSAVRRVIELIDVTELDDGRKAVFLGLNGVPRFKCPKPRCQRNGRVLVCQYLIQNGAQVYPSSSSTSGRGITALGEAIKRRDFDLFRILVETAGEQKRLAFLGRSSAPRLQHYIQAAVMCGAVEILRHLLLWYKQNSGAAGDTDLLAVSGWVDAKYKEGDTLLHIAAVKGDAVILELLLATSRVDPDLKNASGETPLHSAAQGGNQAAVNVLLATGKVDPNSKNESGDTPIHSAVRGGHQAVVNVLLATGRVEGEPLLHSAARGGHQAMVNALLATGRVDPNSKDKSGDTPLHIAACRGHEAIVNVLLATGKVDPNSKTNFGSTLLHIAAGKGHEATVNILLATGKVDPDSKNMSGNTPLHIAADEGHEAIVNMLLATSKVDPNLKNKFAHGGYAAIVNAILVTGKVDPDWKNELGDTLLHIAACRGHEVIVNVLLATGKVDPDSKNKSGDTPLHNAAHGGHAAIVNALLVTGKVDPDSKNELGDTPLHNAAHGGHEIAVYVLLATGSADPNSKNKSGDTPIHSAANGGHEEIVNMLLATSKVDADVVFAILRDSVVYDVRFSADGKYVATGCNRSAQIYNVASGEKLCVLGDDLVAPSEDNYIQSVCFSPDGKYLVTGGDDYLIRVPEYPSIGLRGHFANQSVSENRTVRLWDLETGQLFRVLSVEDGVISVAMSPESKYVAAGSLDMRLRVWDIQTGDLVESLQGAEGHRDGVYSVAFAPNGRDLVSGSLDKTINTWEFMTPRGGIPNARTSVKGSTKTLRATEYDFVLSIAATPDGAWVMSSSRDRSVQFWDSRTGTPQLRLQGHSDSVISVASNPMGGSLATGSGDMRARIWRYHVIQPGVEEKTGGD
ncbi:hypothetical protein DL771_010412 [Monosporascus sp. 5C6A]|nr:hypothetical protein DL771_010412 [Monosporascus sp. 5C6A]